MPQISPMSWILILLFFTFSLLMMKSLLPSVILHSSKVSQMKITPKKMEW